MAKPTLMPLPKQQFLSNVGVPLVGGKVYTYASGTNNPLATYTDAAGTIPQENPITLNVRGEPPSQIYWNGNYRVEVRNLLGDLIYTVDNFNTDSGGLGQLLSAGGSALLGFIQSGATAVQRWVQDKLRERISIADYATAGPIGVGNSVADTTAIIAAIAAVKQAYYDKGTACLYVPTPTVPYRLTQTIDLTEVWNLTISCGSALGFQRQQALEPATDNALFHWYGAANGTMMRLHYTFGMEGEHISLNGRSIAKIGVAVAPSVSGPSVTRKVDLICPYVKNCDFGIVIGDLAAQTDNAPINLVRPYIAGCTSAGVLVNSGNASVNLVQPWFINNGYAPTTGNSFIADGANRGCHLNIVAGFVGVTDWTSDHDPDHIIAGAAICQSSGSLRVNGAWCDDPTKPFYSGFADRAIYFNGVTHFDGSMTLASTPNSIEHNGPQPLVLESCYLYGNVNITSGNQASVVDMGTVFVRAGAGYTGNMVTQYGGLMRVGRSGNNALAMAVGGDFPSVYGPYHSMTVWSDHNRPGLIRAARNGGYMITEHINSVNGQLYVMGNARFDADSGQYKAIAPGACWRHTYGKNTESFDSYQAALAGEVIANWGNVHGFLPGVGGNAITILTLSGQKLTWDSTPPAVGAWSKGDRCFTLNANVGSPKGWVCTASGTPGTWVSEGNL